MLIRHAIVRLFVFDGRHDAPLRVGPGDDLDSHQFAHRRGAAVGGDRKARPDSFTSGERRHDPCAFMLEIGERRRRNEAQIWQRVRHREQSGARVTVFDDVAQRTLMRLRRVEVQREGRRLAAQFRVGDQDVPDRLRVFFQMLPDAERLEHAHRGVGEGTDAAVELGVQRGALRHRIGHDDVEPALGECDGQAEAHHAPAADDDVTALHSANLERKPGPPKNSKISGSIPLMPHNGLNGLKYSPCLAMRLREFRCICGDWLSLVRGATRDRYIILLLFTSRPAQKTGDLQRTPIN